jgi:uncharacterized repeat protein (TIGR03803 family)
MRNQVLPTGLTLLSLIVIALMMSGPAFAQTETVLYNFSPNTGGSGPATSLIFDFAGNLYGTTQGPFSNQGVAFQLKPKTGGTWSQTVMHTFGGTGDGASPSGPLVSDSTGNFYGTTSAGGAYGFGTVFEIKPTKTGYVEHVLHSFGIGNDGANPYGGVILDSTGNLYGTTLAGGSNFCAYSQTNCGTAFELVRNTNGGYSEKILHNFAEVDDVDGYEPYGTLIFDRAGHLYGTTLFGGSGFQGTVFELIQTASGKWGEKIVHNFAADAARPYSGVTLDAAGNLYGTTYYGGAASGLGTVYELSPGAGGTWTETIIHAFAEDNVDGFLPQGGVILDSAGNVYGATVNGGTADLGVVFELSPAGGGIWTETLLFTFTVVPPGNVVGANPEAGLIFNGAGNLYGTTYAGGEFSGGIAFEITP